MGKRAPVPPSVREPWFQEMAEGNLTEEDLMARLAEYAPGEVITEEMVAEWRADYDKKCRREAKRAAREALGIAPKTRAARGPVPASVTRGIILPDDTYARLAIAAKSIMDFAEELLEILNPPEETFGDSSLAETEVENQG